MLLISNYSIQINALLKLKIIMAYTYEYPRPALTVDCVIFGKDESENLKVLLIERAHDPFRGKWALPGGFIDESETAEAAANRELFEETGVENIPMIQLHTFSAPNRDPRGWTISVAFYAIVNMMDCKVKAGDDAKKAEWLNVSEIGEMAFDHTVILKMALERLPK